MDHLDELINELCPNGVEYKKLGEVCSITKGIQFNKVDMFDQGTYPVINGGINASGYIEQYNQEENTITISQGGASAGYVNWQLQKFWAGAHCYIVKPLSIVNNRYLYHFIKSKETNLMQCQYGAGIPALSKATITDILIPVPPLPVQEEIARILDKFTSLEAELEAELEARKQQYEYYRDKLLTFTPPPTGKSKQKVEFKTMGEIGTFIRGNGLQKNDFTEDGVPCIHYGQIYTYYGTFADKTKSFVSEKSAKKFKKAKKGDIIIACTSENVEDVCKCVAWLGDEEICVSGETYVFTHQQDPRYIAYYLQTNSFHEFKKRNFTGTKVIRVHGEKLKKFLIPIPPLEEQQRIVSILDKFEKLITDLTQGLPAEIEARRQQYEYYRDKLLTFKRKTA